MHLQLDRPCLLLLFNILTLITPSRATSPTKTASNTAFIPLALALPLHPGGADMASFQHHFHPRAVITNLQPFTGALGGVAAPAVTNTGDAARAYGVEGSSFPDFVTAGGRSCDTQNNNCADLANGKSATASSSGLTVTQCTTQQASCRAAVAASTETSFRVVRGSDAEFDYVCDS